MKIDIARQPLVPAFVTLFALAVTAMWGGAGNGVSAGAPETMPLLGGALTRFQAAYPVRPANLDATPVGGIATASSLELGIKDGGLKDMKLEPMNFDIQDPLTGMERWNEAVGLAREKNRELTDNMGAMGNAMGNVGNLIGGAAGEWLQWGANAVQAIGQAIPQIMALLGVQSTQATANTVVA